MHAFRSGLAGRRLVCFGAAYEEDAARARLLLEIRAEAVGPEEEGRAGEQADAEEAIVQGAEERRLLEADAATESEGLVERLRLQLRARLDLGRAQLGGRRARQGSDEELEEHDELVGVPRCR